MDHSKMYELENSTTKLTRVHDPLSCAGEACTVHNKTEHSLRGVPQTYDAFTNYISRKCYHGIVHPDPDGVEPYRLHTCDGCCHPFNDYGEFIGKHVSAVFFSDTRVAFQLEGSANDASYLQIKPSEIWDGNEIPSGFKAFTGINNLLMNGELIGVHERFLTHLDPEWDATRGQTQIALFFITKHPHFGRMKSALILMSHLPKATRKTMPGERAVTSSVAARTATSELQRLTADFPSVSK